MHDQQMIFGLIVAAASATAAIPSMTTDWWSDYYDTPGRGLAAGELSIVVAEITVDKHGAFADCTGHAYAGNPQMGPYVCSQLKLRGEFKPARGPDGQKVLGIYRKLIIVANVRAETRFHVPDFGIRVSSNGTKVSDNPFEIQFYLDENGRVSDCSLVDQVDINLLRHKQVVDPAVVQRACDEVPVQLKPTPPRDEQGHPVPTTQNALVEVIDQGLNVNNM
jgi:hypothetical protein